MIEGDIKEMGKTAVKERGMGDAGRVIFGEKRPKQFGLATVKTEGAIFDPFNEVAILEDEMVIALADRYGDNVDGYEDALSECPGEKAGLKIVVMVWTSPGGDNAAPIIAVIDDYLKGKEGAVFWRETPSIILNDGKLFFKARLLAKKEAKE